MKLIPFQELIATPWKNGGGITRELASWPPHATLDDFVWRVSIADVKQSGPFSTFPGIDRVITLLEGDGMQLQFANGSVHALNQALAPYAFNGEDKLHAQLAGSASRDLNLMLRRDAACGSVEVRRTSGIINDAQSYLLLFCATGKWEISGPTGRHLLNQGDTVMLDHLQDDTRITLLESGSTLLYVRISLM